jgi:hypothetical protein
LGSLTTASLIEAGSRCPCEQSEHEQHCQQESTDGVFDAMAILDALADSREYTTLGQQESTGWRRQISTYRTYLALVNEDGVGKVAKKAGA